MNVDSVPCSYVIDTHQRMLRHQVAWCLRGILGLLILLSVVEPQCRSCIR